MEIWDLANQHNEAACKRKSQSDEVLIFQQIIVDNTVREIYF